jgi:hypothetical protein
MKSETIVMIVAILVSAGVSTSEIAFRGMMTYYAIMGFYFFVKDRE